MSGLQYAKRLLQSVGLLAGVFLVLEHYTAYGYWEINDWIGHETAGFILIALFGLWILHDIKFKRKTTKQNILEVSEYIQEIENRKLRNKLKRWFEWLILLIKR